MAYKIEFLSILALACISAAMAVVPNANAVPYAPVPAATVTRQTGGLSSLLGLGGIGSSIPGVISAALPFVLMMGLGAVILPLLGSAFFFREGQKRGLPSISPAFMDGVSDVLEKVMKALDAVEKKY